MFQFAWLWALIFLPLPLVIHYIMRPSGDISINDSALRVPFIGEFESDTAIQSANHRQYYLALFAWLCLVSASMNPQWIGEAIDIPISGRDLMLAIDLSGSMAAKDFVLDGRHTDRLTATKKVAGDFINQRVGDRLGLILFGDQAYLQAPLTFDRKTVKRLLDESAIGLAGKATSIGDAIGLAVKRFNQEHAEDDSQDKILILLSDGAATAGVDPIEAAQLAAQKGLKIYTIGIGAEEMIQSNWFGSRRINPSADLDEDTLIAIAESTNGRYFRARDTEELKGIYQLLDELEPVVKDNQYFRPHKSLFYYPLALALLIVNIMILYSLGIRARQS